MTLEEFKTLLDIYGSDLGKWPHDRRLPAAKLLDESDAAKEAYAAAFALDQALRSDGPELTPERQRALIEDIMDVVECEEDTPSPAKDRSERSREDAISALFTGGGSGGLRQGGRFSVASGSKAAGRSRRFSGRPAAALPSVSLLAACLLLGVLSGMAVMHWNSSATSILPISGGLEFWTR